ncbi:hypothetical protein DF019_16440 [Burkholderia cenocepacia]|nr:hypothetical protein DF133_13520 [Burkholderia cenocepacia]RQV88879.1 hypothetical protein DF019_16440 [Burkholderia cenocepacia]RRA18241.1 hypothetical protein DF059_04750 [Burkholderia cenocepacia]
MQCSFSGRDQHLKVSFFSSIFDGIPLQCFHHAFLCSDSTFELWETAHKVLAIVTEALHIQPA